MTIENIVAELDAEISRLEQVRNLLSNGAGLFAGRNSGDGVSRKKRVLSPEARQRIAEAQRKRWAAQKKAAK